MSQQTLIDMVRVADQAQRNQNRHHVPVCPCNLEEVIYLECIACLYPCPHRIGADSNLFYDAKRDPSKYPDWLYHMPHFNKIRRHGA